MWHTSPSACHAVAVAGHQQFSMLPEQDTCTCMLAITHNVNLQVIADSQALLQQLRKTYPDSSQLDQVHQQRQDYLTRRPDFAALAQQYPAFAAHVQRAGDSAKLDFTDSAAVHALTQVLFQDGFGVEGWHVPAGHLVPSLPNRMNYLMWVKDLLALSQSSGAATGAHCMHHVQQCCCNREMCGSGTASHIHRLTLAQSTCEACCKCCSTTQGLGVGCRLQSSRDALRQLSVPACRVRTSTRSRCGLRRQLRLHVGWCLSHGMAHDRY